MVITVTNQKGGCGKTSTAITLAAGLAHRGFKVLAVDADPQTNFTLSALESENGNLYEVMTEQKNIKDCISSTTGKFDIVAGSLDLINIAEDSSYNVLKKAVDQVKGSYDYIVIDTPPHLGILVANALVASDCLIVPLCADIFSFQGLVQLNEMIEAYKEDNPDLHIDGLLLTRFNARSNISKQIEAEIESEAAEMGTRLYKARIREGIAVRESQLIRSDLFTAYPKSNVTKDYSEFIDEFLKGRK